MALTEPGLPGRPGKAPEKGGTGSARPGGPETGQTGPGQTGPGQTGPGQTGPGQTGPGNTGTGTTGPGTTGPDNSGPSNCLPGNSGPSNSGTRDTGDRRRPSTLSAGALVSTFGTHVSQIWAGHQRLGTAEHTSLDQRFGALQVVRVAIVALVIAAAAFVPAQLGLTVEQVLPLSLGYLAICLLGETIDHFRSKRPSRSRTPLQQMLLPIDSVYLAVLTVPSGGAQSDFILLFAVQLIAVTLLASPRTGVRLAMWDSVLLIAISLLQLGGPSVSCWAPKKWSVPRPAPSRSGS